MKDISEKKIERLYGEQIADEILSGRIPGGSQLKQEDPERLKLPESNLEAFQIPKIRG